MLIRERLSVEVLATTKKALRQMAREKKLSQGEVLEGLIEKELGRPDTLGEPVYAEYERLTRIDALITIGDVQGAKRLIFERKKALQSAKGAADEARADKRYAVASGVGPRTWEAAERYDRESECDG
jgi:hypothetical protein